ncbi:MAG: ribosomal protein S18-alanine N-acetyltransferase [Thiomargarita sp.]|nr:ribosomal protein S18-alanine N-acetyltransferase [Thiomargarita sp.]
MIIRQMQECDLSQVIEIEQAAYVFPWTLQNIKDCLNHDIYTVLVLEIEKKVMGYGILSIAADEAELLNLCIHPKWQACGYGHRLLTHLLQYAQNKNVHRIFLEVRISNTAAITLYDKTGFKEVGKRKAYYQNGTHFREDALILAFQA